MLRESEAIGVDVLIVGGGVAGLWLLNDLQGRYSTVLLERGELGGEQTCHSHVYLHRGYNYREVDLALNLKGVTGTWEDWLKRRKPKRAVMPACFGFQNPANGQQQESLWKDPQLRLPVNKQKKLPAALAGGSIQVVYRTAEIPLNGTSLVRELSRGLDPFIGRIESVDSIEVEPVGSRVTSVQVTTPKKVSLTFRPGAVVLTAGRGNQSLLELASGGRQALLHNVQHKQQIRKAHMLVVKGKPGDLKPLTGIFDTGGLFIVSRRSKDQVVWLISDRRSPPIYRAEDGLDYCAEWWLKLVTESLKRLAPRCFGRPDRLRWGVYEAPKAEGASGGHLPDQPIIEHCWFRNMWAVWPTKLTLAPVASGEVIKKLQGVVPAPSPWTSLPGAWRTRRVPTPVAPERWQRIPLLSWADFRRCYNL